MLRLLRAGMPMEAIADELNTSVKSLYRKRTALSERLGAENFNEACLFIFKNKLLDAGGNDPCGGEKPKAKTRHEGGFFK
jgi:hypothetical protein